MMFAPLRKILDMQGLMPLCLLRSRLLFWTVLYLSVPYFIFFAGYLRWYFALGSVALLAIILYQAYVSRDRSKVVTRPEPDEPSISRWQLVRLALLATLLVYLTGAGKFIYQTGDWKKHNAILFDLVDQSWPVYYQVESSHIPLVYYTAYYLPAAVAGKLGGLFAAHLALYLWTTLGLWLAMLWFSVHVRKCGWLPISIFILFSGLDSIGVLLFRQHLDVHRNVIHWVHIEWWTTLWQYSANASLLCWVPHQAVSGWLITSLVLDGMKENCRQRLFGYLLLSTLWSPLIALGLVPFVFADFLASSKTLWQRCLQYVSIDAASSLLLLVPIGLYYAARIDGTPPGSKAVIHGWIFQEPHSQGLLSYQVFLLLGVFLVLEFGIYLAIIMASRLAWSRVDKAMLAAIAIFLLLLPLYRYARWNDLVMRCSIPALFLLQIYLVRTLLGNCGWWRKCLIAALLVIGAVTPLVEYRRQIQRTKSFRDTLARRPSKSLVETRSPDFKGTFLTQYVGNPGSVFFNYLARKPGPSPGRQ